MSVGMKPAKGDGSKTQPRIGVGISLEKFAKAKRSGYDKQAKKDKAFALNAKTVNKYRKLKKRLETSGEPAGYDLETVLDGRDDLAKHSRKKSKNEERRQSHAKATASGEVLAGAETHTVTSGRPVDTSAGLDEQQPSSHLAAADEQQRQSNAEGKKGRRQKPKSQLERMADEVQQKRDAEKLERDQQANLAEQRRAKLAEEAKERRERNKLFRKKTVRGQPVMKYRMDKILQQLGGS